MSFSRPALSLPSCSGTRRHRRSAKWTLRDRSKRLGCFNPSFQHFRSHLLQHTSSFAFHFLFFSRLGIAYGRPFFPGLTHLRLLRLMHLGFRLSITMIPMIGCRNGGTSWSLVLPTLTLRYYQRSEWTATP